MRKLMALLAGAGLMIATGAFAAPIIVGDQPADELSLQTILNNNFEIENKEVAIDAYSDQSGVGSWLNYDGSAHAYAVAFMKGDAGNFGIYSLSTGATYTLMTDPSVQKQKAFGINADGDLVDGDGDVLLSNFGFSFGFFWQNTDTPNWAYTEGSKNGDTGWGPENNVRALTYLIPDGTQLKGALGSYFGPGTIADGDDDWIIAFEDLAALNGDGDFQDAVFYVKDIIPTPEPGTVLLLGAGLLGLGFYGRRRMKKA